MIDPKVYREMGLNDQEYQRIVELLGREPTYTELGMFAVMWSEHCGYKYSRPILRRFREYRQAMESGGLENAGVVDIGDGWGIVMKVESHNHPSAVEPFQGAATGVGGILRDIFTMGARPIALLDSPALRSAGQRPQQVPVHPRGGGHLVVWQLRGRANRCWRGLFPPLLFGQPAGQCDGGGYRAHRQDCTGARGRSGQLGALRRFQHGTRRYPRRDLCQRGAE
jgi:hypothetical protein